MDWYQKALDTLEAIDAARNNLIVALGSSIVATILATMTAILITRFSFRGKQVSARAASLPLIVPYIVLAVALLILFSSIGVTDHCSRWVRPIQWWRCPTRCSSSSRA